MGGGGAMRAAAKAARIGSFTGGIRGGAVAESFASLKSVRPGSTGVISSSLEQAGGLKVESAAQRPVWEIDDWEFADDLIVDRIEPPQPRMVFGPVPTLEETKEATSELKDALEKVYLSSPKCSGSMDSSSSFQETKACVTYETSVPNSAMQAFKFLKESPTAQTVVASIACDPNVWNAVMQNPALVEFLQSEKQCRTSGAEFEVYESEERPMVPDTDGLMGFFEDMKNSVLDMVSNLTNFIQSLFADPDEEKKSESADGNSKSTFFAGGTFLALAVMVIMVVVVKRG